MRIARVALWAGAIVDALAALQLMLPVTFTMGAFTGLRASGFDGQMAVESAALLVGWSVIEIWAAREPLERQAVMFVGLAVLTVFWAQNVWLLAAGRAEVATTGPIFVLQTCLVMLFVAGVLGLRKVSPV